MTLAYLGNVTKTMADVTDVISRVTVTMFVFRIRHVQTLLYESSDQPQTVY